MTTVLPTPVSVPSVFETIEAKAAQAKEIIKSHLSLITVEGLKELETAIGSAAPLSNPTFEAYRTEIESFLGDAMVLAQMAAQLGLVSVATVAP